VQEVAKGRADFIRRIFLNEMNPLHRNFVLVVPTPAEAPRSTGNQRSGQGRFAERETAASAILNSSIRGAHWTTIFDTEPRRIATSALEQTSREPYEHQTSC
jgi:hypothetical protein